MPRSIPGSFALPQTVLELRATMQQANPSIELNPSYLGYETTHETTSTSTSRSSCQGTSARGRVRYLEDGCGYGTLRPRKLPLLLPCYPPTIQIGLRFSAYLQLYLSLFIRYIHILTALPVPSPACTSTFDKSFFNLNSASYFIMCFLFPTAVRA